MGAWNVVEPEREQQVARLLAGAVRWASALPDVRAMALVGSWARRSATMESDVDLVVLTSSPGTYVDNANWILRATGEAAELVGTERWGVLTSQRVVLESGLEVEFGFAPAEWAGTCPVDPGTATVAAGGLVALYDPDDILRRLAAALDTHRDTDTKG